MFAEICFGWRVAIIKKGEIQEKKQKNDKHTKNAGLPQRI